MELEDTPIMIDPTAGVAGGDRSIFTTAATTTSTLYPGEMQYEEGEEMTQTWNAAFVVFAYCISFVSAYSAVHLWDHNLWRCEGIKKSAIIKHPDILAGTMLGFGAVWCMHYVSYS